MIECAPMIMRRTSVARSVRPSGAPGPVVHSPAQDDPAPHLRLPSRPPGPRRLHELPHGALPGVRVELRGHLLLRVVPGRAPPRGAGPARALRMDPDGAG